MTMYAPSDVRAVSVPTHLGGCGEPHEAPYLGPGSRWELECPLCEAALGKPPLVQHGWANRNEDVSLTPDERRTLETQSKEGSAATAMLVKQLGNDLAAALRGGPLQTAPAALTEDQVLSALKSLPNDALAELLKTAGLAPEAPVPDGADTAPVAPSVEPTKKASAPARRAAPAAGNK